MLNRQKPFTSSRASTSGRRSMSSLVVRCSASAPRADRGMAAVVTGLTSAFFVSAPAAHAATEALSVAGDAGSLTFLVGGGVAIAGLGAALVATDPQKRCASQCISN